ncbi:MAG: toxin-antitoxin system HicB family antitoxin [Lentisphaeria bacterium]|nr:type II toxin-antitoxin system HicB family antitoxin [Lentisphaeria bacterium]NQZ71010.1 toxin-antitoxin system HicB family antitoxin [Lentisphaeria bacterium]
MSTISVRLPDSLHKRIKILSEKEHVSMNQLIALAVAEKISVLETEDYLSERAQRGNKKKFNNVLSKVPHDIASDIDKL